MNALNPTPTTTTMLSPDLVHFLLANQAAGANFWNPSIMPFAPMLGTPQQLPPPPIMPAAPRAPEPPKPVRKQPIVVEKEKPVEFVMGSLPTSTYYPTHFMRGTQLHVANGQVKRVEELSSDDFLRSAAESDDVVVNASVVRSIKATSPGCVTVTFETGAEKQRIPLKCQIEHPFFVLGKGWSSCMPRRTGENYGLDCELLQTNDICIVLTRKEDEKTANAIDIVTAERDIDHFSRGAALREQLAEVYYEHVSGRVSAPPERIVTHPPTSHRQRRVSE